MTSAPLQAHRVSHRVVALVNSPQSPFELAVVSEVFGFGGPDTEVDYEFSMCTPAPGPVETLTGIRSSFPADSPT